MNKVLEDLVGRYPELLPLKEKIFTASECLIECFKNGGKLLICGNGGSSSDSDHVVGELMKGFEHSRPVDQSFKEKLIVAGGEQGRYLSERLQYAFPAISLSSHTALITAISNDNGADLIFAQQVSGYGNNGDVLLAFSTSGNSINVLNAIITAKAKGITTIGMTGEEGGKMKDTCDMIINVPQNRTSYIQELHLPVFHSLCLMVENSFFQ
jgi:D-sedoheptulose 7-phosphate isomerase